MEYNLPVSDWKVGDQLEGFYVLRQIHLRKTNAGKTFLSAKAADRSGVADCVFWDYAGAVSEANENCAVKLRGVVNEYRGAPQLSMSHLRFVKEDDPVDLSALVPVAPIDRDATLEELRAMVGTIEDEDYRAVAERLLEENRDVFPTLPAGKEMHHAFLSGLLMHTANMLRAADYFAALYAPLLNRSLLLTGTLLHDVAKAREFTTGSLGLVTDYSTPGKLLGHVVMGAEDAGRVCRELGVSEEKTVLLQHMLLSHHGTPEFGAARVPQTAEAELLSQLDMLDSRMEIYAEQYERLQPGQWSEWVPGLDRKIYKSGV